METALTPVLQEYAKGAEPPLTTAAERVTVLPLQTVVLPGTVTDSMGLDVMFTKATAVPEHPGALETVTV